MASHTVQYFGMETVEQAVYHYFMKHGVTEKVRDELIQMEIEDGDAFFQLVDNYVFENQ